MARGRRRRLVARKDASADDSYFLRNRRSSMRVNLSYVSNLSDSGHGSLKRTNIENDDTTSEESISQNDNLPNTVKKSKTKVDVTDDIATPATDSNVTVLDAGNHCPLNGKKELEVDIDSLAVIKEKEQRLNRSCMQLKDAIMNKTQALFDKGNELAIKTSEVLAATFISQQNVNEINDKRSPSIRIDIGKNDQIIMSGDGKKRNPVEVNSMVKDRLPEKECNVPADEADENDMDCSQSIASTPKKSILESSNDEKRSKIHEAILRIPVTRLFVDDNDPNNSMSDVDQHCIANNLKSSAKNDNEINKNDVFNASNTINYSTSPILSQGVRRSRFSRLSLKKKHTKPVTESSSRFLCNTTNESFINKIPLTCSSFVEKPEEIHNKTAVENSKTVDLREKNELSKNCGTINLDDNENHSKTINVENSANESCMEITTIPATCMPVVRKSLEFQQIIRTSLNLDGICIEHQNIQKLNISTQTKASPNTNHSKNSNKESNNLQSLKETQNSNTYQEDSSTNTVRTSLNVNTSLDQINSADYVQKENKMPNNLKEVINKQNIDQVEENEPVINLCQNVCIACPSIQANTSLNFRKNLSTLDNINKEKEKSDTILSQSNTDINEEKINSKLNNEKGNSNKIISEELSSDVNQEKENDKISSRQPSTSTTRSSMQVNTSLDSIRKSPIAKRIDFNKILSMVEEASSNDNQSKASIYTSNDQSLNSDSELENISLMERIKNISATKRNGSVNQASNQTIVNRKRKSVENENVKSLKKGEDLRPHISRKSKDNENIGLDEPKNSREIENNKSIITRKSIETRNITLSTRKSTGAENTNSTTESSIIEATPYPASRSVLLKTIIKNNIGMNTLDPKKFVDLSDDEETSDEYQTIIQKKNVSPAKKYQSIYARKTIPSPNLMDTVILNTSDESSSESDREKDPVVIDESLNKSEIHNKSNNRKNFDEEQRNKKIVAKRKLYPLRENSQLISFSPADIQESPNKGECKEIIKKKKRKVTQKKKQENNVVTRVSPELVNESEPLENEVLPKRETKTKKKPRKILSKKIVIKKVANLSILDKMMVNEEESSQRLSERNSLREFDLRRLRCRRKENLGKRHKIVVVITGLSREDKDLVKSVIKSLGSATLEANVTPRTTHVISSGVRTINLLKGILRGCWLLSMEWALKSLENEKWLDPGPYEMSHFSKAVQENRRDRQLFGKAYVPELFVTCGFIYVENGTTPPASALKELIKIAGGRITEDPGKAEILIGKDDLKENWILDSITTGEVQPIDQYKRN